jgi:hypothetical protein
LPIAENRIGPNCVFSFVLARQRDRRPWALDQMLFEKMLRRQLKKSDEGHFSPTVLFFSASGGEWDLNP